MEPQSIGHATPNPPDAYPSRVGGQGGILARQDPVVRGTAADGPLSAEELERFDRQGFLHLRGFFGAEDLAEIREELDRLWAEKQKGEHEEVIREPESRVIRSIFDVYHRNALFHRLASDARLVDRVRQILGDEVYIHQSRINYKPGFSGKEFYWHSDFETWHTEDGMPRMRAVSCSIALTGNTASNGPLMVVPGSHQHYVACPGEVPENHFQQSLRRQESGTPEPEALAFLVEQGGIVQTEGPAGSVTLFECNLMHGSNSNITPLPRSNVFYVYNAVSNHLEAPFGGKPRRPEFVASTDFTPVTPAVPA